MSRSEKENAETSRHSCDTQKLMLVLILHTTLVTLRLQSTLVTLRPCTAPSPLRAGRPSAKGWQKGLPEGFVLDETPPSEQPAPEPAPTGNASYPSSCLDPAVIDLDLMLALNAADADAVAAEADAIFGAIDTNGDGSVSLDELSEHLFAEAGNPAAQRIFAAIDADADGEISSAELRNAFSRSASASIRMALGLASGSPRARPATPQPTDRSALADELFEALDADADGRISYNELRARAAARCCHKRQATGYSYCRPRVPDRRRTCTGAATTK